VLLDLRRNRHAFAGEDGRHPLRRPRPLGRIVDRCQRLQRNRPSGITRQSAAKIVPVAAHRERRRPDRTAEVESEDPGIGVAPELQGHQRQQHALAGAGRTDHQRVPDIADMERQPERRRTLGLREQQRRSVEVFVAVRGSARCAGSCRPC
jgi:hypothetical protein